MADKSDIYYKVRDVVRQQGHSETESCRVYKDWHIELRVGSGHVSVWTSEGLVYLTMLDKPVHHKSGAWEDHLSRLHMGRPVLRAASNLREILRAQALENEEEEIEAGDTPEATRACHPSEQPSPTAADASSAIAPSQVEISESKKLVSTRAGESVSTTGTNDSPSEDAEDETSGYAADGVKQALDQSHFVFSDTVILIDDDSLE